MRQKLKTNYLRTAVTLYKHRVASNHKKFQPLVKI